jgi:hypothetical protein
MNKQIRMCASLLQHTSVPLVLDTISHRQVWHQVARQKLARPLLLDLPHEILRSNLQMIVLDTRGDLFHAWRLLFDDAVDILRGNLLSSVKTRTILHPLPKLHARNFGSSSILHQVVDRDATITADPGSAISKSHRDVSADALLGDLSGNIVAQQVCGSNFHILSSDIILQSVYQK